MTADPSVDDGPASERARLATRRRALRIRADVLAAIRAFFRARDFLDVETPVRIRAPALEQHIDAEPSGDYFLRTSPELHMKRLLGAGYERIFQIGPCFRRGERGALHHPEYTMLEWYRADADYLTILDDTRDLIRHIARDVTGRRDLQRNRRRIRLDDDWRIWPVREAFLECAGWDPVIDYDADRFDIDLVDKVEPALRSSPVPVILIDYPRAAAALARCKPTAPDLAER